MSEQREIDKISMEDRGWLSVITTYAEVLHSKGVPAQLIRDAVRKGVATSQHRLERQTAIKKSIAKGQQPPTTSPPAHDEMDETDLEKVESGDEQ